MTLGPIPGHWWGHVGRSRLQRVFIVAQIALTQSLLVAIAMIVGIVISEMGGRVDDPLKSRIVRVQFDTHGVVGSTEPKEPRIAGLMDRIATLPGVEAVVPQSAGYDFGGFGVYGSGPAMGPRAEETVRANVEGTAPATSRFRESRCCAGAGRWPATPPAARWPS